MAKSIALVMEKEAKKRDVNVVIYILGSEGRPLLIHNKISTGKNAQFLHKVFLSSNNESKIMRTLKYIDEHYNYEIDIAQLAKKVLPQFDYKVNETAYFVGYENPATFSRDFKKYFGYSPKKEKDN